jgi:hypothetical protein
MRLVGFAETSEILLSYFSKNHFTSFHHTSRSHDTILINSKIVTMQQNSRILKTVFNDMNQRLAELAFTTFLHL